MSRDYSYYVKLTKKGAQAIFSTAGSEPNPISFDIKKDITAPNSVGTITIYNVGEEACDEFIMCAANEEFAVEFALGYKDNYSVVYQGIGKNGSKLSTDSVLYNLQVDMIGGNAKVKNSCIALTAQSTHKQLKEMFAQSLGLMLCNLADDNDQQIGRKYYYSGSNLITELRRFYRGKQYVSIADGQLVFTPSTNSTKLTIGNTHVLTDQLFGVSPVDIGKCDFHTFLMPNIKTGEYLKIEENSKLTQRFSGFYKVESVKHSGTIDYRNILDCSTHIIASKVVAI